MNFIKIFTFAVLSAMTGTLLVPFAAQAAPQFNTLPVDYAASSSTRDLPMIDAKNLTTGAVGGYGRTVSGRVGDQIQFTVYFNNRAADTADNAADNTLIKAFDDVILGALSSTHRLGASISASNLPQVTTDDSPNNYGGRVIVNLATTPSYLLLVPGTTVFSRNGVDATMADTVFGFAGINVGQIRGSSTSGTVKFIMEVVQFLPNTNQSNTNNNERTQNSEINITNKVLNATKGETTFANTATAQPGDKLRFQVRVDPSGQPTQHNVILTVSLPAYLNYVSGTIVSETGTISGEYALFSGGRNLGSLLANSPRTVVFDAMVANASAFSGSTTLTSTANVRSDQLGSRQANVQVIVTPAVGQVAGAVTTTQLRHTAFNLTQNADATTVPASPGDVIVYTLNYKNITNATQPAVVVENNIRDILELSQISSMGGASSVDTSIRFPAVSVSSGVEISRSFQAKIMDAALFPADSDLVMISTYGNELRVFVRKTGGTVAGASTILPPRTGAGMWLILLLASFTTVGYWLYRKNKNLNIKMQNDSVKF